MRKNGKRTLDMAKLHQVFADNKGTWDIGVLQVVAYVAAGGGLIGRMYAEQPADAYTDARVRRRPYGARDLENIRLTLVAMAEALGLDPHRLPPTPNFHNCGVF